MNLTVLNPDNRKGGKTAVVAKMLTVIFTNVIYWLLLFSLVGIKISLVRILLIAVLPAAMYFVTSIKKYGKYSVFYSVMIVALCLLLGYSFFFKSVLVLFNQVADVLNSANGLVLVPFKTGISSGSEDLYLTVGIALLGFFSASLFSYGLVHKRVLLVTLISVLPLVSGLLVGLKPSLSLLVVFVVVFTVYLCISTMKNESGLSRTRGQTLEMAGILFVFLVIFSLAFSSFESSNFVGKIRTNIGNKIYNARYYEDENAIGGMPKGDLTNAQVLNYTGNIALIVKLQYPSQIYLRSYVGDTFENGKWSHLAAHEYTGEYLGILQYLEQEEFYPYSSLSRVFALDSERTGSGTKLSTVEINNVADDSSILYAPYELVYNEDLGKITDNCIKLSGIKGNRQVSFTTYSHRYVDFTDSKLENIVNGTSCKGEELYRRFVYDKYLTIPEEYKSICDMSNMSKYRYNDVVYAIRELFDNGYTYSELLEDYSGDPLVYFAENKEGFDCHFATLATYMLRSAGIPARYAEGYFLSSAEMKNYLDVEDVEFEVYDTASHAWVEVYVDNVGWVPVEVTPGFYSLNKEETNETVTKQQKFKNYDQKFYYDEEDAGHEEDVQDEEQHSPIVIALIVVASLLVLIVVVLIVYNALLRKRIASSSTRRDILIGYKYVTRKLKIKKDPYDYVESYGDEYKKYLDLVYKEVYASKGLSLEERQEAGRLALLLADNKRSNKKN